MAEILNLAGIHNNGKAELVIGIRKNQFALKREDDTVHVIDSITGKSLTINDKEVYTKDEVNSLLSGVMIYCGKYTSYELLSADIPKPVKGMVVFITFAGGRDIDGIEIPAFSHLVYNGEGWKLL